ncbi:LysR family transcriptional regulator [Methylophilus aquaticus]|uniref:LysR family transcriptional regulator n=1 Tax=Methylophilus aquaticus TaxID=1971610 RepID=A0ABT9JU69_9PROT|nr:LysR family transcriptional regulator [Methylophilus aquaticus]MDP8567999.1 LysR family transcriptional regulator [Methylophilus aquaticus]
MKNLTLRQMRIFITAAQLLSFSRAAETLHITTPAVSQQIREMEIDLSCALFNREKRSVSLTTAGEHFLGYALKVMATLEQAQQALQQLQGVYSGSLTIGLVSTTRYFFPTVLAAFQKEHPQVQLKVDVKNRAQLIDQLHSGEIDLAIMGKPPTGLLNQAQCFAAHPHVFIVPAHHPLAAQKRLAPEALNQYEIITREQGSGTRYIMEMFFNRHHLNPKVRIEISGNETIKQAVIADLGISLVSAHTISQELKNGQLSVVDIVDTPILRDWYVVMPQKRALSKAAEAFQHFMMAQAEALFAQIFPEHNTP